MTPNSATSTPALQATAPGAQTAAPGSQSASASPAAQPTPAQLFWEVARMAFVLMTRLLEVLRPIQSYYLAQSRQAMHVCTELCRVMLTIRFAPERITQTQLRHLTRARHILQALFGYTLPLGPRTSSSATATFNQSPSASPLGARTPSSATTPSPAVAAVPEVPGVPEVPEVPGVSSSSTPSPASSKAPVASTLDPPHPSHPSHSSQSPRSTFHIPHSTAPHSAFRIQHSAFSPYIPDANTLVAAVRAATLPASCAGALLENPGEALVRALHELHAVYFSLYPNQPPTPSPSPSPSPSSASPHSEFRIPNSDAPQSAPSQSQSSGNLQSTIQVRRPSEPSRPQSSYSPSSFNPQSEAPHSEFRIPHSSSPP